MAPVQCGSCRTVLLDSSSYRLLDAHSGSLHSCSSDDTCSSLKDRSNLFLDTENMPSFVYNTVMETGYTTGRLKCPKCSSRIGAFNFVKGTQCACGSHILPSVHLIFSKVDYQGYALNAAACNNSMSCSGSSRPAEDEAQEPLLQWEELAADATTFPHTDPHTAGTKPNPPCLHSSCKVLPHLNSINDTEDPPPRCKLPTSASLNSFLSHFSGSETEQLLSSVPVSEAETCRVHAAASRERLGASGSSVPEVSFSVPGSATPKNLAALSNEESAACGDCNTSSCRDLSFVTGNDDVESSLTLAVKCSSPVSGNSSIFSDTETADAPSTSYDNSNSHNTSTFPIESSLGTESQITNSPEVNRPCSSKTTPTNRVTNSSSSIHSSPSSASVTSTVSPTTFVTATSTTTTSSTYPCITDTAKAATTSTSEYPELIDYPDHLVCAICLELLFSPFSVKPCSHVFCEPCLRRLARPCPTNTACPLCREIIGACHPAAEYCREVRLNYPKQVAERHKFEQNNSAQHLPLPWLQNYRFLNFNNSSRHPRSGVYSRYSNWWRTALWIFWVDAIGFLLIITLNWFLTQNIGGGEQQLPSPPHLPVGHNPAVVLDGSGDGGGPYSSNNNHGKEESFEEYARSIGAAENRIKGMASTDYQRYLKYHSPHTVSPIQSTAYATPSSDRSSTHAEKTSNLIEAEAKVDELTATHKAKKHQRNGSGERIAAHFFKSFDNFGDVGIDLDEASEDEDSGVAESVLVTKLTSTPQPRTRFSARVDLQETDRKDASSSQIENTADADAPQDGVRWTPA